MAKLRTTARVVGGPVAGALAVIALFGCPPGVPASAQERSTAAPASTTNASCRGPRPDRHDRAERSVESLRTAQPPLEVTQLPAAQPRRAGG